jgi:hypothetical protein
MPYRNKDEYNDYKREYMREYREKKKLSKGAEKLQIREIPTASYNLPRIDARSYPPHPKDMDRNKDNLLPVSKDEIFESVERREKVERLRTRFTYITRGVGDGPFWSSSKREFNQKCESLLKNLDNLESKYDEEHVENLKKDVSDYEFLSQVIPSMLDRLFLKYERADILKGLIDMKREYPENFSKYWT